MDSSSSSKVTVEYHDPSGIFSLVSPSIASRLPLRNLNWQSPSRPLRQIKSLHLDFVPDDFTKTSLRPPTAQVESDPSNSFDVVRTGAGVGRRDGRRHQIPGLQTSPYLKIYVLRCDDKDAYKATERGKIRQWVRDNSTAASSSSKKNASQNENHSASEYLILHVVIPDTIAASEPRWRESQREPDELKERKQGAKWPGKSTRTVFDKLRADFNDSSKTDRVAQLRLSKDTVPADLLPTPAQAVTYNETAEEQGKTWNDLLTKLKSLILIPFDKRVRQYEQDIAEQESRRSLPGFNFCTFFIHKEGLARALEAIGLVEDALVIYDELSLGLESVLRDLASGQAEGTATTFATYTDDIKERILCSGKPRLNGAAGHKRNDSETIDPGEIDYRERIVRSNISVFDFQCYLFGRRKALILRLANAVTARQQLGAHTKEGGEDLVLISEVCWRASNFLHNTARVLRQDLLAARSAGTDDLSGADVDALVCSWLYTIAGQILDETAASALEPQPEHGKKESLKSPSDSTVTSPRRSQFADLGTAYPQRTTSLPTRKSRVSELQNSLQSMHSASEETLVSPPSSAGTDGTKVVTQLPGLPELVTYRAELVMMRRKMVEQLAAQRGWLAGWASLRAKRSSMETVDLNGSLNENVSREAQAHAPRDEPSTLIPTTLTSSLLSEDIFHETYDHLSDQAMRYYHSATQLKSAEAIVGDLAILRYQQGDYDFAAKYFEHVLPTYREEGWASMKIEAMQILRVCWRELGKKTEEVGVLLDLVEKEVVAQKSVNAGTSALEIDGSMVDAVALSEGLEKEVVVPAGRFFSEMTLEGEIVHLHDQDGFALNLNLRHYLDEDLQIDEAIARLVLLDDPNQEICLMSSKPFTLRRGRNELQLQSSVATFGPYLIDSVILKAKNIYFTQEFQPHVEPNTAVLETDSSKASSTSERHSRPWVFVYPAQHAFDAEISLAKEVHIDKPRHLKIRLSSGWNEIETLDLRLRPATAGLRLHLADAQLDGIQRRPSEEGKPGILPLGPLAKWEEATIQLPYSLDQAGTRELVVHFTAQYRSFSPSSSTEHSSTFLTTARLPSELPLDVDVNDVFHDDALFSNFTVRATSKSPLVVAEAALRPSQAYDVEAPPGLGMMTVFERFPTNLAYKITRVAAAGAANGKIGRKDAALALSVQFVVVDDLIARRIRHSFARALGESPFAGFGRLLCPLVFTRARKVLSAGDVEMAVLLGEVRLPKYESMGWIEIVNTLPTLVRPELATWLQKWHGDNTSITLDLDAPAHDERRSITISVEVPTMDFVHRAALSILDPTYEVEDDGEPVLALGEPYEAELAITSTTAWSNESVLNAPTAGRTREGAAAKERQEAFIYDIHADAETWLVGGPRRGHLTASHGSRFECAITLIPLKLGSLPLPSVDVQPGASPSTSTSTSAPANDGQDGGKTGEIRCETHCASAGLLVRVIRDQRSTRVEIPEVDDGVQGHGQERLRAGSGTGMPASSRPGTAETVGEAG